MWSPPPPRLSLKDGDLHVWRLPPLSDPCLLASAGGVLSETERTRCGRFLRAEDQERCAASRTALRILLSRYLSLPPGALSIGAGQSGKPHLDGDGGGIQFNLAHAGDLLVIAVSRGMRVGIDVERIRDVREMESIVDDFFGEPERARMQRLRGKARRPAFFRLWTRREAAAKAMGLDLFDAFARCELPAFGKSRPGFRPVAAPEGAPAGPGAVWWIRDFRPAPGCAGALCVERKNSRPAWYQLPAW